MGNCQAIDSATLLIQHQSGRVERLYSPVSSGDVMKLNPGHHVALLLASALYASAAAAETHREGDGPIRVTRIKLLRPSDTLVLGNAYRLLTFQEVERAKYANKPPKHGNTARKASSQLEPLIKENYETEMSNNEERARARTQRSRATWQPALQTISESGT